MTDWIKLKTLSPKQTSLKFDEKWGIYIVSNYFPWNIYSLEKGTNSKRYPTTQINFTNITLSKRRMTLNDGIIWGFTEARKNQMLTEVVKVNLNSACLQRWRKELCSRKGRGHFWNANIVYFLQFCIDILYFIA